MYWLYFDLREQLSDHRSKIEQGEWIDIERIAHFILCMRWLCFRLNSIVK